MGLKVGSRVLLPDGSVGVIYTMGGQVEARAIMVGPDGKEEQKPVAPEGSAICHILDARGESVMEKHPTQMRFITKEVLVPLAQLKTAPDEAIPASRK